MSPLVPSRKKKNPRPRPILVDLDHSLALQVQTASGAAVSVGSLFPESPRVFPDDPFLLPLPHTLLIDPPQINPPPCLYSRARDMLGVTPAPRQGFDPLRHLVLVFLLIFLIVVDRPEGPPPPKLAS